MPKPKLYIGHSLTQAPPEFVAAIADMKRELHSRFEVLEFIGLVGGTPADVYQRDIVTNVGSCDLFVAICDYPAIGLGYEIATAIEKHDKPVLALAHKATHISRLVEGIPSKKYSLVRYERLSEVPALIADKFKQIQE